MEVTQQNQYESQQKNAIKVADVQENKSHSPDDDKGERKNKKNGKPRRRKRSAKQLERWKRYRENMYTNYGAVSDTVSKTQNALPALPYVNPLIWPVIRPTDLPVSHSAVCSKLRADADVFVPRSTNRIHEPCVPDITTRVMEPPDSLSPAVGIPAHPQDEGSQQICYQLRAVAEVFVPSGEAGPPERMSEVLVPAEVMKTSEKSSPSLPLLEIPQLKADSPAELIKDSFDVSDQSIGDESHTIQENIPDDKMPTDENPLDGILEIDATDQHSCDDVYDVDITNHETREDDMFGVMSVYAESGLHCMFDKTTCSNKMNEDFGYVYFSVINL